jgi:hypothetical protein
VNFCFWGILGLCLFSYDVEGPTFGSRFGNLKWRRVRGGPQLTCAGGTVAGQLDSSGGFCEFFFLFFIF